MKISYRRIDFIKINRIENNFFIKYVIVGI